MLDMHELWANETACKRPLAGFDALSALYDTMRELSELQLYFASTAFNLPYNNKMAHFCQTGSTWRGQEWRE